MRQLNQRSQFLNLTERTTWFAEDSVTTDTPVFATLVLDGEGLIQYVSASIQEMLGFGSEVLLGKFMFSYVYATDLSPVLKGVTEMLCNERDVMVSRFRFRDASGAWTWVHATFSNLLDDPQVNGIVINLSETQQMGIEGVELEAARM